MRLSEASHLPPAAESRSPEAGPGEPEEKTRVRLKLSKRGRARMVGHLEYLTMFQRAVRRAKLPVRFSQGYHPAPKMSFLEALPMGVASEAELVDLELTRPVPVGRLIADLNTQLPDGFEIVEGEVIPWKAASPSAALASSRYRVPLPQPVPAELTERIISFLEADQVWITRLKKEREERIDLRPNVLEISRIEDELELELKKGSPLQVAAWLLQCDVEEIRRLQVRKIGITLKDDVSGESTDPSP